jgi:2-C-methyl-D-erythritol 2,4-cyclodiphosphate synthase
MTAPRIGLGRDRHPFGPGEPLRLGGVEIAGAPRLHGHSDGDVVLHAVADALLGAAGLGDLGRLAPADDRTTRGIGSAHLLEAALARLATAGWRPAGLDLVIVGARPRLSDQLDAIRDRLAALLGVAPELVSAKASTGNLQGPEGEGRAIAAHVVATLEPMPSPAGVGGPA